ncbi:MAG: aminotransferase class I/II-fold pyridoxal phosphate-dependent enzyme [Planctomycetes bacterium]|nr:aminotransferase class I/II-fold pyridoxal phosphate-dependent enzyme [Planctomycetota bacterium]
MSDGRVIVAFAGCDYLGLSQDPQVIDALRSGLDDYGVGAGASRSTTGTCREHIELERELSLFLGAPDAVLLSDGTLANLAVAEALFPSSDDTTIAVERDAHPSLRLALRGRRIVSFDHHAAPPATVDWIVTDGVYPSVGKRAPIADWLARGHRVWVDDAHGFGVLGDRGRGVLETFGLEPNDRLIVSGTLSKAAGTHGGFVAGTADLASAIRRTSPYVTATPPPPALARASRVALSRIAEGSLRRRLNDNSERMRRGLESLGIPTPGDAFPVFAWAESSADATSRIQRRLLDADFLVPCIRYPGGPDSAYLRLAVSALHEPSDIDALIEALGRTRIP